MLGHRGCRLGISYPEIYIMQVEAILEAIFQVQSEQGTHCILELMIPLISEAKELERINNYVREAINSIEILYQTKFNVKLGCFAK